MTRSTKLTVRRKTAPRVSRTPEQLAELRATRAQFQRDKPTLAQVLASTGEKEAVPLGDYLRAREVIGQLQRERERQGLTLAQLSKRTGYDPAVLSKLLTGRQANTTLATLARVAAALGKEVIHQLRPAPKAKMTMAGKV